MKNHYRAFALCMLTISMPAVVSGVGATKGKHIVQDHIAKLNESLKTTNLSAEDRRKLETHLRHYFDNARTGHQGVVHDLTNPESQKIANIIKKSYSDILKTPGSHKEAANRFADQAAGQIALYIKPKKYEKRMAKPSRLEEKPSKKTQLTPLKRDSLSGVTTKGTAIGKSSAGSVASTAPANTRIARPPTKVSEAKSASKLKTKEANAKKPKKLTSAESKSSMTEAERRKYKEDKKKRKAAREEKLAREAKAKKKATRLVAK